MSSVKDEKKSGAKNLHKTKKMRGAAKECVPKHPSTVLKDVLKAVTARQEALAAAVKARKASGWFSSGGSAAGADVKFVGPEEDLLATEVKLARSALASAYGKKPVPFILPISTTFVNTAANQAQAYLIVDVSSSAEWSALSSIFDEYRLDGGVFQFSSNMGPLIPVTVADGLVFALAYDPVDSSVGNVRNVVTRKEYKLFGYSVLYGGAAGATFSQAGGGIINGKPLEFQYRTPPGGNLAIGATGLIVQDAGAWKSSVITGTPCNDGYLMVSSVNGAANAAVVLGGVHYLHVQMRVRGV